MVNRFGPVALGSQHLPQIKICGLEVRFPLENLIELRACFGIFVRVHHLGFQAVDTAVGRVGTLVCWDQWYPEGARLTALKGAEVLFYPTAIGWHPAEKEEFGVAQYDAWQTIQRAHAIANGVYVAGVNRVGHEEGDVLGNKISGPGLEFWGGSFIADPFGRIIAKASHTDEEILIGEVNLALLEDTRRNWPFLRDRRIDAYAPITKRFLDPASAWSDGGDSK